MDGLFSRRSIQNWLPIPATNPLPIGTVVPLIDPLNFELHHVATRQRIRLTDYLGQSDWLLLAFTRIFSAKQYCPLCYPHILELNATYEQLQDRGIEVLMITSTELPQSEIVLQDLGLKMPLLSDPSRASFRDYQVGQALGAPLPAQFLLDATGRLIFKHLFSFIEPNASLDRVLAAIDRVRLEMPHH